MYSVLVILISVTCAAANTHGTLPQELYSQPARDQSNEVHSRGTIGSDGGIILDGESFSGQSSTLADGSSNSDITEFLFDNRLNSNAERLNADASRTSRFNNNQETSESVNAFPQYETHIDQRSGPAPPATFTETIQVTKTHTLRVPSTSDVWVTEVKMVNVPVSVHTTSRSYRREPANTVTSFVRVTRTPIDIETRTVEVNPTKTVVSVFTHFVTETSTVELWQPVVHMTTSFEVVTVPVVETQTLLQRLFTTITTTTTVDVTRVRNFL